MRIAAEGISNKIAATDGIIKHGEKETRIIDILAYIWFVRCFFLSFSNLYNYYLKDHKK